MGPPENKVQAGYGKARLVFSMRLRARYDRQLHPRNEL